MNLSINLNNLTGEGYAALVLGIIFTVATIATAIFFAKHKDANKVVTVLAGIVFPALAVFCWAYLILIVCGIEIKWSLLYALVSAVGYVIVSVAISYIIYAIVKARANRPVKVEEPTPEPVAQEPEAPVEEQSNLTETQEEIEEPVEEPAPVEEQKQIEDAQEPLLLSHTEEVKEEEVEEPVEETPQEPEEVQVEETEEVPQEPEISEEEEDDGVEGVVFTKEPKLSFMEQLNALPPEMIGYYYDILEYSKTKEISMVKESRSHVIVKMGRMRLVEFKFNRGKLVCRFMAGSSELKNYSMAEKAVKIKEKPVMIEIENENSVAVAKNMIDIVCKNILEAREAKEAEEVIPPVTDEVPNDED